MCALRSGASSSFSVNVWNVGARARATIFHSCSCVILPIIFVLYYISWMCAHRYSLHGERVMPKFANTEGDPPAPAANATLPVNAVEHLLQLLSLHLNYQIILISPHKPTRTHLGCRARNEKRGPISGTKGCASAHRGSCFCSSRQAAPAQPGYCIPFLSHLKLWIEFLYSNNSNTNNYVIKITILIKYMSLL